MLNFIHYRAIECNICNVFQTEAQKIISNKCLTLSGLSPNIFHLPVSPGAIHI
jgi:hypothetical protein